MTYGTRVKFAGPRLRGDLCDLRASDPPIGATGVVGNLFVPGVYEVDFGTHGESEFLVEELEVVTPGRRKTCGCFFCWSGKEHPAGHTSFSSISHKLLQAESLDPKDSVPREACDTCGHVRVPAR